MEGGIGYNGENIDKTIFLQQRNLFHSTNGKVVI
jgi:hypothetical protein